MFMLWFALGLIGIVTGCVRFFACLGAEYIMRDRFTAHRSECWKRILKHYAVTFLFFYLSFKF